MSVGKLAGALVVGAVMLPVTASGAMLAEYCGSFFERHWLEVGRPSDEDKAGGRRAQIARPLFDCETTPRPTP